MNPVKQLLWFLRSRPSLVLNIVACLIMIVVFAFFSLAKAWAVIAGVAVTLVAARMDRRAPMAVAFSLLLSLGLLSMTIWMLQAKQISTPFYRPQERLSADSRYYQPNATLEDFHMPHGDLVAMGGDEVKHLSDQRTVTWYTDSLGLRNKSDIAPGEWVVLGDSFVVGNGGIDQNLTLSSRLSALTGEPFYNAGLPGGIQSYVNVFESVVEKGGYRPDAILVLFEGNDFICRQEKPWYKVNWFTKGFSFARRTYVYRFMYGLTRRALFKMTGGGGMLQKVVTVKPVGGKDLGFYNPYVKRSEQTETCFEVDRAVASLSRIADGIRLVVYVPTKYRVYYPWISEEGGELPDVNLDLASRIARELGKDFLDVTDQLRQESADLLNEGRYTYFRDDTHWNAHGVDVAARAIAERLRELEADRH